jgi:LysM repeat protein
MPLEDDLASKQQMSTGGHLAEVAQYKWWIIGGLALMAGIIFYLVNKNKAASNTGVKEPGQPGYNANNVDPSTGFPEGSPADIAALNTYGALHGQSGYGLGGGLNYVEGPGNQVWTQGHAIPAYAVAAASPVGPGDTGATGANSTGDTGVASRALTIQPTVPVQSAKANHNTNRTYTTKPGDNLSAIASAFGIQGGWQTLYRLNQHVIGPNPNLLPVGTKLTL